MVDERDQKMRRRMWMSGAGDWRRSEREEEEDSQERPPI